MKNENHWPVQAESSVTSGQDLRQRAEAIARDKEDQSAGDSAPPEDMRQELHELHVHQIELEMQNDELRRVQAELEDAWARYVDLYDFAPVGYCTLSSKGLILEANLTAAILLGVPRGELIQRPISRFIQKEDQDIYYLHKLRLFETGEPQEYELRMIKRDGAAFWTQLTSVILQNAAGEPICRIILSDITEHKRAEEALRESEEKFRVVQELSPDGFTIFRPVRDANGQIVDFTWLYENDAIARLNGTDPKEVLGKRLLELFPNHRGTLFLESYLQVAKTGEPRVFEAEYGSESMVKPTWFRIVVVRMGGDIAVLGQDITERKRMEEELKQNAEELARKNKLVTEFFTNISHEFKTPLSVILIQLELMKMYMDDERKMNEYIAAATQNSYRLTRLVSNLLDITKLDAGYLKANFANADIVSLIRDICESVDLYAKARSVQLSNKTQMLNKVMPIDTEKMERIMLNLLSNAIKHTGKDGNITVNVKDRKDGGVTISVEDTGEGIPEDKLKIIFDRFAQVNTSLTRQTEGSGIGLALVKSMVEILGGSIKVKSEAGKGSKFTIELPLIEVASQTRFIEIEGYDLKKKAAMELSDLYLESR